MPLAAAPLPPAVSGLRPHTAFTFRVRALNAAGSSVSDPETFRTAPAPPSCPERLQLRGAMAGAVEVGWAPPAQEHGAAVAGYQLECGRPSRGASVAAGAWKLAYQGPALHAQVGGRPAAGVAARVPSKAFHPGALQARNTAASNAPQQPPAPSPLLQVDGLAPGTRYQVRARAANAVGWGPWSEPLACATQPDAPAAPPGLAAKATGTSLRIGWDAAEDHGSAVLAYELEAAGGGSSFAAVYRGEAQAHRMAQLQPSTAYQLRVRAVNAGEAAAGRAGAAAAWLAGRRLAGRSTAACCCCLLRFLDGGGVAPPELLPPAPTPVCCSGRRPL